MDHHPVSLLGGEHPGFGIADFGEFGFAHRLRRLDREDDFHGDGEPARLVRIPFGEPLDPVEILKGDSRHFIGQQFSRIVDRARVAVLFGPRRGGPVEFGPHESAAIARGARFGHTHLERLFRRHKVDHRLHIARNVGHPQLAIGVRYRFVLIDPRQPADIDPQLRCRAIHPDVVRRSGRQRILFGERIARRAVGGSGRTA
jgi:hypothetical protein